MKQLTSEREKEIRALSEANDKLRERIVKLREAMQCSISKADDYADSGISRSIRDALAQDNELEKNK